MPFAPITVNTKTFNQSGDGRYMLSTVTFGQPSNYFNIKGGSLNKDRSTITGAITRVLEKDVTINGIASRKQASVQLVVSVPNTGFTSAELDSLCSDIDAFLTSSILDRILAGES
jgi:hypothetical protein